ncbi:hypothetical protein PAT3040_00464 [Paenibacillus agaridevorans]|uniref:Secreted protein n=1 Tax=Paenibacillus agaridevorans TaxID=171404 RepID=A0A2R5EIR8_9BACL|nr:hypothetical protein [Paenibacillus agaridevorans]GBG05975.1 hypothetical protein PAT3040_00464 [Paenibacillus agaridevorans]
MKKRMMLILSGMLTIGLLTACGTTKESADGHAGSHQNGAANPTINSNDSGEHDGHATDEHSADNYKASFSFASGTAKASENTKLNVQVTDSNDQTVQDFEWNHEKLMHIIIVNKDLSYFNHIHPEWDGKGTFTVDTSFPNGGEYKVFADFVPKGGSGTTLSEWVKVDGETKPQESVTADAELVKVVDGKEVTLALGSTKAKAEAKLSFTVKDDKTKEGISNLEQYLGAVGHVVILSEDAEQYLHVHPVDEKASGPEAEFMTAFPNPGTYKIWGQFQHEGKVFTVPYVVKIQ